MLTRDTARKSGNQPYLRAVLTDSHIDCTEEPRFCTAVTIATAIPEASIAYSIDVAPELLRRNERTLRMAIQLQRGFELHLNARRLREA
jgi:hypothetical protein